MLHKLQPSFVFSTMMLGGQVGVHVTINHAVITTGIVTWID